jgi:hypothetical protein
MSAAYHRVCGLSCLLAACGDADPDARLGPPVGPDCAALLVAAERAEGCDPALARLAEQLRLHPDESSCRREVRRMLRPEPASSRVRSVWEGTVALPDASLSETELAELAALPLPGIVVVAPDLPPQPGVPSTAVRLAGRPVDSDGQGRFVAFVGPGPHTMTLRYAGEQRAFCVTVGACEQLRLLAHGAQLARHAAVRAGPCAG